MVEYTYYTVQFRITHSTNDISLKEIPSVDKLGDWSCCGIDGHFAKGMQPWIGSGNDYHPKDRKAYNNYKKVWALTGYGKSGWFNIKYAIKALKRLRALDLTGVFDYFDGYGRKCSQFRHEFRIVRVVHKHEIEPITIEDMVELV